MRKPPDESGISPDRRRVRDDLREEYRQITADLARYDRMRSFGSAGELGAAALGELGGAVLSPESWLGVGAKGASWLWRAGKAALQQGAITGAADPIIQGLNIKAGAQDKYDPARTGLAVGAGALLGGSLHAAAEALSHTGARPAASGEAGTSAIFRPRKVASDSADLAAGGQQAPATSGAQTGWFGLSPRMKDFREQCCDCGLIHRLDFRIVDGRVEFRTRRDGRATAAARRSFRAASDD